MIASFSISVAQVIFWLYSMGFYYKLKCEEKLMQKQPESKTL